MNELKPCPFCGSKKVNPYAYITEPSDSYCQCENCGTIGASGDEATTESAITAWNRRAPVERQAPEVERGWLIEHKKGGYFYQTPRMNGWTDDSIKALRFARKCDAEAIAGKYNLNFDATVTEHEWHDSIAAAPCAQGRTEG